MILNPGEALDWHKSGLIKGFTKNIKASAKDFESRGVKISRDEATFKDFSVKADEAHLEEIERARREFRWSQDPKLMQIRKEFKHAYSLVIKKSGYDAFNPIEGQKYFYPGEFKFEDLLSVESPLRIALTYVPHDGIMVFLLRAEKLSGLYEIEKLTQELLEMSKK